MSVPKRRQRREASVPMGPGEFINPDDRPRTIPWKRVLDIAVEELPDFLPSLLESSSEECVDRWLTRWNIQGESYAPSLVRDMALTTLNDLKESNRRGTDPPTALSAYSVWWPGPVSYESVWVASGKEVHVKHDYMAEKLDERLTDINGNSVMCWDPYQETRAEATKRIHGYLELVLNDIEQEYLYPDWLSPDGRLWGNTRTPKVPRRHIAWFVRWRFGGETIYGIHRSDGVAQAAIRKGIDNVAAMLEWGFREVTAK